MNDIFDTSFSEEDLEKRDKDVLYKVLYPDLDVRILASLIPPRDQFWDFITDSKGIIAALFDNKRIRQSDTLHIYFPENFMSVAETREFMDRLVKTYSSTKHFFIVTQSSVILTDCASCMVKVLSK